MSSITNFTVFDTNTGRILSSGMCQKEFLHLQGKNVLELKTDDATEYIDLKTLTSVKKPTKPDGFYTFDYSSKTWVPDVLQQWNFVKSERNQLLQSSDWTQLPDVPLSTKENWGAYRQALRDITLQPDPFNITWPQPPN